MGSTTCSTSNESDVPADSCLAKLYYRDPTSRSDPLDIKNYVSYRILLSFTNV